MKKILIISIIVFISLVFSVIIYNSKEDLYIENKKFYKETFNSQVVKIVDCRGTKIFYSADDFFYTDFCRNNIEIENIIKVGDIVKKQDSILEIFRENDGKEITKILTTKIDKPADNYFSYFVN